MPKTFEYDTKFITTGDRKEMTRQSDLHCRTCSYLLWENDDVLTKYWCEKCNEFAHW